MKKTLFVLLSILLTNCASNDLISSQDDEQLLSTQRLSKNSIEYFNLSTSKNSEIVVMDLPFQKYVVLNNGGCTFDKVTPTDVYKSTSSFGPHNYMEITGLEDTEILREIFHGVA